MANLMVKFDVQCLICFIIILPQPPMQTARTRYRTAPPIRQASVPTVPTKRGPQTTVNGTVDSVVRLLPLLH